MTKERILAAYDATMKAMASKLENFPWLEKKAYAAWLSQSYYFVCHSTRLLGMAAGHATREQDVIHKRMAAHIREELGHEKMALSDLNALGQNIDDYPELGVTQGFWQSQYYLIEHVSPAALFGYILFLEGISATKGPEIFARVKDKFGPKATVFWKVHAEEDQDHIAKAIANILELPSSEQEVVLKNFHASAELYCHILEGCRNPLRTRQGAAVSDTQPSSAALV